MELQKQVCTFEQAKRLAELGVNQESLWYWNTIYLGEPRLSLYNSHLKEGDFFKAGMDAFMNIDISCHREPYYSAFTVAELGEMLPAETHSKKYDNDRYWGVSVESPLCFAIDDCAIKRVFVKYDTEAEARAAMLIYLLEQKLITPEQINPH